MKGVAPAIAVLIILGATSALVYISSCSYIRSSSKPYFDLLPCSSPSSCAKAAYNFPSAYSRQVGITWHDAWDFLDTYDSLEHACSMDFYDANGNIIKSVVKRVTAVFEGIRMKYFSLLSDILDSDYYALGEMTGIILDLNAAGIQDSHDPILLEDYGELKDTLRGLSGGTGNAELLDRWQRARDTLTLYRTINLIIIPATLVLGPLMRGIDKGITKIVYAGAFTIHHMGGGVLTDDGLLTRFFNESVGNNGSILSRLRSIRTSIEERKAFMKQDAEEKVKDARKIHQYLSQELKPLKEYNLDEIAKFLPSQTQVGTLRVNITVAPAVALARSNQYLSQVEGNYDRFKSNIRYISSYEDLLASYQKLRSLRAEVDKYLNILNESADSCKKKVRSHHFYDDELEYAASLKMAEMEDADALQRIRLCKELLSIVQEDERYRNVGGAADACISNYKKRWGEDPGCNQSDPYERYSCCKTKSEQRENAFKTSPEYVRFRELYDTIEELLIDQGRSDLLVKLYTIDKNPSNTEDLAKALSKLLSFYDEIKEELSSSISSTWKGYLSTTGIGEISLLLKNPLPIPLKGKIKVPFDYYGYRVEGNGITVSVEGKYVHYNGKGSATIIFQSAPVDLEEEVLSTRNGLIMMVLHNPYTLPVEHYFPYTVDSLSTGSYYEKEYLYLAPGGYATVEVPALEMNTTTKGEYIYVYLHNVSPYTYDGVVSFHLRAESGPQNCYLEPERAVCKVRISPGSVRVLKFKGLLLPEENKITFSPNFPSPPQETPKVPTSKSLHPETYDQKLYNTLLNELSSMWKRAKELNATDLLPFDESFLDNAKKADDAMKGDLLPLLVSVDDQVKKEAQVKTKLLGKLAEATKDPEVENLALMAKKGLLTGDYVLPLALSRGVSRYFKQKENNTDYLGLSLALLVMASILGAYLYYRANPPHRKKKRRIPRF